MKRINFQIERQVSHRLPVWVAVSILTFFFGFDVVYGQGVNNYSAPADQSEMTAGEIHSNLNRQEVPESREVSESILYPPNWETPESSRVDPHFLIVTLQANPRIGNIPIQQGDYIGAFFVGDGGTLVCGGSKYWKADSAIIFAITGDDPETTHKEGFSYGEVINYKLFSFTTMKNYDVTTINFDTSPGSGYISGAKWYPLAISSAINVKANVIFDAYATANPNPVCMGNPVTLAGNIFIGTTGNYTFNWTSTPTGFSSNLQYPPAVTPLVNTTYNLSVFDGLLTSTHQLLVVVNQNPSQVNAGADIAICTNQTAQIAGSAINYGSVLWTTSGTGLFNNATIFNPVYTPGISDKQNGSVVLTLTVQPPEDCTTAASDQLTLTILPLPSVNAGPDKSGCKGSPVAMNVTASSFSTVQWTTAGDGTFSNAQTLNPLYYPGNTDVTNGNFTLTVLVNAITPCSGNASDQIKITLVNPPTAGGPSSKQLCETTPTVTINGSATNYSAAYWTTAGDGTFNNPNALVTVYSPGTNDKLNGETTVTLHAMPNNPCSVPAIKNIVISIKRNPLIDAGNTNSVCQGQSLQLNASASHYNTILWTTSGNGVFNNPNSVTAIYTPGSIDIAAGQFTLTLTGTALVPCTLSVSDNLLVQILGQPTVQINTPSNQTICAPPPLQLSASATNYDHLLWATSGNGTFSDPAVLDPVYTPGTADVSGSPLPLTLTAFAAEDCGSGATNQILVTFIAGPSANSGSDVTICQGSTHLLAGTATNQAGILWTTSGTGTFSSTSSLTSIYTPGIADITAGTVTLTLTASAVSPCTASVFDAKILTIEKAPIANAGEDANLLPGGVYFTATAFVENATSVIWSTSGDGVFDNPTVLHTIYTPGAADINSGTVTLTLSAFNAYCNSVFDDVNLFFELPAGDPTAFAGQDAEICETESIGLTNATATNYSVLVWSTNGDGSFNNVALLHPVYTPGQLDKSSGVVQLCLKALPQEPYTYEATDCMLLTIQKTPSANAGNDATICQGSTHTLAGTATNQASVLWSTSGTGTFSSTSTLTPVYTPGTADITAGTVTLTLTASAVSPCTASTSDTKILIIQKTPTANAGNDATVCQGSTHTLSGTATNQASILWSTSGTGTFSSAVSPTTVYTPGAADITAGTVTLTLTASAVSPCTASASDNKILIIQKTPTANAGSDATVCQGSTHMLAGAATNQASVLWSTSGTGTFGSAGSPTTVYTPGAADITAGTVTLTLTASAVSPCTASVSDGKILVIQKTPTANAGNDATICQSGTHTLAGTATNQASVLWTTSGTGTFSSTSSLTPVYTPGAADITAGTVTLTLIASAVSPCTASVSDGKILVIQKAPTANAGSDATVCQGSTHTLAGTATNQASVVWSTSGTGTFSSTSSLTPVYTPGAADITAGTVTLTLTASAVSPCTASVSDAKILVIQKTPTANAGNDASVCQGSTHTLAGTATNQASVLWTTSGTGTFGSAVSPTTVYTPGAADITAGTVTLTLTASAVSPCTASASDNKILIIQKTPTANAGSDATIIEGVSFPVSATASNYSSILWQTNGDGTFSNPVLLNPVYYPGVLDIDNSTVILTIAVSSVNPCAGQVNDFLTLTIMRQQLIQIPAGWSGFSSFVLPLNPAFDQVMAPVANNLIIAKNMLQVYWPEFGINTIGTFDPAMGYLVKMNAAATLPISGFEFGNKTINLTAGWNILPVLSPVNIGYQQLITQLGNKLVIVTEIAGTGIIWPEEGIYNIPFMVPGKAYMIKLTSPGVFTFPD